ncbi:unnamed protein product, partial [Timema podura]|nr:unnamed protein product [Timema podura]
ITSLINKKQTAPPLVQPSTAAEPPASTPASPPTEEAQLEPAASEAPPPIEPPIPPPRVGELPKDLLDSESLPKYKRDLVAKQRVLRAELQALQPQSGHCRLEVSRTEIFESLWTAKRWKWIGLVRIHTPSQETPWAAKNKPLRATC